MSSSNPSRWTPLCDTTVCSGLSLNPVGRLRWQLVGLLPCGPRVGFLTSKLGLSRMTELEYLRDSRVARPAPRAEVEGRAHPGR